MGMFVLEREGKKGEKKKMTQERKITSGVMFLNEQKRCASRQLISKGSAFYCCLRGKQVGMDASSSWLFFYEICHKVIHY